MASAFFTILQQSNDRLVVEWTAPELTWTSIRTASGSFTLPDMNLPLSQTPGAPQLPFDAQTFDIRSTTFTIVVLDSVFETRTIADVCPAPTRVSLDNPQKIFVTDPEIYQTNRFVPAQFVTSETARLQGRQFVRVQVNPVKYNPLTGETHVLRYIRYAILPSGRAAQTPVSTTYDSFLTKTIAGQIGQPVPGLALQKTTSSTEVPERVKLYTVEEGVYRVTGAALSDLGLSLATIPPQQIKIVHRGEEIACRVTGVEDGVLHLTDEIHFYAQRLSGDGVYYHAFTDTNIYWLHWDAGDGRRFGAVSSDEPASLLTSLPHVQHVERDLAYYQGDSNAEIQDSRAVPGEGWVWDKAIDPGELFKTSFDLPHVVRHQENASLRLRVRGATKDNEPNSHHLRVSLNGELLIDTFFDDRQELIPTVEFPVDLLKTIGNELQIESVKQNNRTSRFLFDWFEIRYEKSLTAESGWVAFDSPAASQVGFWVTGFSSPDVLIWDIDNQQQIEPYSRGTSWTAALRVESAAITDGNFARFILNETLVYSGSRGISIVALDGANGKLLQQKTFDTFASKLQSDSLALLINSLPDGTIVLAGVRDDGANNLTPSAIAAFQACGSQHIGDLTYRDSWAFIGRKGESAALAEQHVPSTQGSALANASLSFDSGDAATNVQFMPAAAATRIVVFDAAGLKTPVKMSWHPDNPALQVTGADYLIITHEKLKHEAQRLADYRQSFNGFTTAIVTVNDIYDGMNHGIQDPNAIKEYLAHANAAWQPQPRFVLLFGDASWDPKGNVSSYFSNYVPSLGNPVSDALFVCFDGKDDFVPDVSIGRIPVKLPSEARAVIDKIIEYESTPSARWKKNFLFISGGFDDSEQRLFQRQSNELASEFVDVPPTYGHPLFINKDEEEAQADARSLILEAINAGALWTNFIGHAASRTWELMFNNPDIDDLSNYGRYPFISSMTCHTGRFAEPTQDSFGEKFLLVPAKGAIAFWGTSGWGYSYEDYLYLRQLYPTVLADSVRTLGDIILLTKFGLWSRYGAGAHIRNLILQYNLMGDPALTLGLPTQPDMAIEPQDLTVDPLTPSESDSTALITVRVQNWGLSTRDSVRVDLTIEQLVTKQQISESLALPAIGRVDSLMIEWPLRHMAGPVEIRVEIDPEDLIPEVDEMNNAQSVQVTVLTSTFAHIAPLNNSLLPTDNVVLKIQTPQQYFDESARYIFEIDTSMTFSSSMLQQSPAIPAHPLLIKWRPNGLLPQVKYFWRVRNQDGDAGNSFVGSFYTHDETFWGWQQADARAAKFNVRQNVEWTNGAQLEHKSVELLLQSAWTNSVGYALIDINGQSPMQTARGVNLVVLHQHSGELLQTGHFDTYANADQTRQMIDFVNAIPSGRTVLAAVSDEGSRHLNEAAYQALESIGSVKIRQLGYRDMWAIIGKKGAAPGSVPEAWEAAKANGAVVLKDTLSVLQTSGRMLSERIGPATRWSSAEWQLTLPDSSDFNLHVLGYDKVLADTVRLFSSYQNERLDLTSVDAGAYPFLFLDGRFNTDGAAKSPLLKHWSVTYEPAPDLTIGRQLVAQSADTILVGQNVTFYLDVYNVGLATAYNVPVIIQHVNQAAGINPITTIQIDSITVDHYAPIEFSWTAGAIPGEKQISITVDPENIFDELSEANNSVITSVFVHADTVKPDIHITFDDREIYNGDLVDSTPLIVAKFIDNNPELRLDSTRVKIYLDGGLLSLQDQDVISIEESPSQSLGELHIQPTLEDGRHVLEIQFSDMSQNSVHKRVDFSVESDLALRNVLNYPNPFDQDTEFSFHLTRQAAVRIKIYTVAGRLIQTLDAGLMDVGYNRIYWDGRDAVGDRLANGVYLYKIVADSGDASSSVDSKLIVMR